jgi:hypothetical protein
MSTLTLRATKGSPLTNTEVDTNFSNLNTDKLESTYSGALSGLTGVGTLATGTWNATVITGQYGGTGVANTGKTITLGGNLTTSGAFTTTLTATANTTVTLPTTGTLATLTGTETLTNKTLTTPVLGVATATSINKVAITAPATSATLTIADGTTLSTAGSVSHAGAFSQTFTATANTTLTLPTTGTLATLAGTESLTNKKLGSLTSNGLVTTSGGDGTLSVTTTLGVGTGGTGTTTAFTAGSIVFAGGSGVYSQDNTNLFWDDTNNRLGIGTATPGYKLVIAQASGDLITSMQGAVKTWTFRNQADGTFGLYDDSLGNWRYMYDTSNNHIWYNGSNTERMRITSAGGVSFGTSGSAYGTSGQILTSNGNAAPTWTTSTAATTGKAIAMAMVFGG